MPEYLSVAEYLETAMLFAFSVGWYCSIAKMLRTRQASGKSLGFVGLVCLGYLCGVLAKTVIFYQTGQLSGIIYVYGWNLAVTAFDGWLVYTLTAAERSATISSDPAAPAGPDFGEPHCSDQVQGG